MIINGELETGLGGGVCQVSTTVFNAAYEAGLPITSRTNHALYISHYPLGRDATVDYPNIDLKFVNDTGNWLLLRTFVGSSSLVVNLYGTPQRPPRRDRDRAAAHVAAAPVERTLDPTLTPGERGRRGVRPSRAVDLGAPHGLRGERQAALRLDVGLELRVRADGRSASGRRRSPRRSRKPGDAGRGRRERTNDGRADARRRAGTTTTDDGTARLDASAVAIASTSQAGMRVGRSVVASTVPCVVQPSAIVAPSRVIAYSKRKRAPRTSRQRAWTSSRSSNTAGAR